MLQIFPQFILAILLMFSTNIIFHTEVHFYRHIFMKMKGFTLQGFDKDEGRVQQGGLSLPATLVHA